MALMKREKRKNVAFAFEKKSGVGKRVLLAQNRVNCDCYGGKLQANLGYAQMSKADGGAQVCNLDGVEKIVEIKVYDSAKKTYEERFGVLTGAGEFYEQESKDGAFFRSASGLRDADVFRFAGEDFRYTLAFIGEDSCLYRRDNGTFDVAVFQKTAKAGCYLRHRVFVGVKPSELACSAPEREMNFTESVHEGGLLRFPSVGGEIVGLKSFQNSLYLFFEHGIMKVNAVGAIKDFTVEELVYAGGKIYGKSLCVGKNGIYFMASDGAYCFDGKNAERLFEGMVELPKEETSKERSAAFFGRILMRYYTQTGYKTLVVYEDGKECYYVDGLPIFTAEEGGRCLFTDKNGVICQLCEGGENCFDGSFLGAQTDFGVAGRKTLTKLHFVGKGSFVLRVKTSGRNFAREVVFQDGVAEVRISEPGETFTFDFLLSGGTVIDGMRAELLVAS